MGDGNPNNHFFGRHYDYDHATGPFRSLNPTNRWHQVDKKSSSTDAAASTEGNAHTPESKGPPVYYVWRSRDNRKGRHAIAVDPTYRDEKGHSGVSPTNSLKGTVDGLLRMVLRYPVWDVSYDVAVVFTIGSVIWVINAFFSWLPLAAPSTEFSEETTWASGISALIGATVFEFGSVLLMLEAINENRADCFGWAVEESLDGLLDIRPEGKAECQHSHSSKGSFVTGASHEKLKTQDGEQPARKWIWWPTWYEFKTHYIREIGFLACSSQMFGATVFWISGFTALPPILNSVSLAAQNGIYWLPQVVGGVGFIVSSFLFMIEVQPNWYTPAPTVLGWHIGLWNLIGAIGFTLCGALGFDAANPSVLYALTLSTFIGSWAFLVRIRDSSSRFSLFESDAVRLIFIYRQIGSAIQWYESLNKYPIWVDSRPRQLAEQQK